MYLARAKEEETDHNMEGLMPELVALVLSYVDPLTLPCCRAVPGLDCSPPAGCRPTMDPPPAWSGVHRAAGRGGPARPGQVGARQRLSMGRVGLRGGCGAGRPRHAALPARRGLPVGPPDHFGRGRRGPPRGASVGEGQRLPVGHLHVCGGGRRRPSGGAAVDLGPRLPV